MDHWGYTWEPIEVHTEDKYILTTFHVTGTVADGPFTPTKEPILMQHGLAEDASSWMKSYRFPIDRSYTKGKPLQLQLADRGHAVFLGNNRGTEYSQGHETLEAKKDPEYWAHSYQEMGLYDDPANIDMITAKTGHDKIYYIGYSQGTIQMIYGLSHNEDYLSQKIIKAILLAPCKIANGFKLDDGKPNLPFYENNDFKLQDLGVYAIKGPNWVRDLIKICENLGSEYCHMLTMASPGIEAYSTQNELLIDMGFIEQRFQEWTPDYKIGTHTDLVPIDTISKVPIVMLAGTHDEVCSYSHAEQLRDEIATVEKFVTIVGEGHIFFTYAADSEFVGHITDALHHEGELEQEALEFLN